LADDGKGVEGTRMKRLLRWLDKPIDVLFWIGLAAGVLMMLHVSADVAGRNLFNRPIEGTTETVAAYYMVLAAYLPWAWLARSDRHIVAGFFKRIGSPRFDFWVEIAVKCLTILYLSAFVYQTFLQALRQTRAGEVWLAGTQYLPVWPSRWVLPLASGLMLLYLLLRVVSDIARRGERAAPEV
jgi:TRAP-type C4-dicarboxylate transport system permease small subunit